jgi:hypothetical protein
LLIFVFAGVSCGRPRAILAEFAAVPNVQSAVNPAAMTPVDVRPASQVPTPAGQQAPNSALPPANPVEVGGPKGPEPTRYGDWERNGRCVDF